MARPTVRNLPAAPSRNDQPDVFVQRADAFLGTLQPWGQDINDATDWVNLQFVAIEDVKTTATQEITDTKNQALTYIGIEVDRSVAAATIAEQSSNEAYNSASISSAAANFKGRWVDMVGSFTVPSSFYHEGLYYQLLENVSDITLEEPGVSNSYAVIKVVEEVSRLDPLLTSLLF